MNRLIEVAAVNPYLVDMFLDKIFVALHVFINALCQPANQPQNSKVSILATKQPFSGTVLLSSNEEAERNGSLKNALSVSHLLAHVVD